MSIGIHFHDGELAQLSEFCVHSYTSGFRNMVKKGKDAFTGNGKCKKAERYKSEAFEKLASLSTNLTDEQKVLLDKAFQRCVDSLILHIYEVASY
jgi:hypothetical protein